MMDETGTPAANQHPRALGLGDLAGFLIGRRQSIERVAANPYPAIAFGLISVVVAGFCREYDQEPFETKMGLFFLPLLASLAMGTWLFAVFQALSPRGRRQHSWPVFMALFWMTAPCAWLYAIPVERLCPDSLTAIKANFALLGIVATWRVVLMGRALSILTGNPGVPILLVGSSFIVVPLIFLKSLNVALMVMGGGVHSPEQKFIMNFSGQLSSYLFFGAILALGCLLWKMKHRDPEACGLLQPADKQAGFSWTLLLPPALAAAAVASQWTQSQAELGRYQQAVALMQEWDEPNQPPKRTGAQRMDAVDALVKAGIPRGRDLQPPVYLGHWGGGGINRCIGNFLGLRPAHSSFLKIEVRLTLTRTIENLRERNFIHAEPSEWESFKALHQSLLATDVLRPTFDRIVLPHLKRLEEEAKASAAEAK
ncbi:MAG: hypothetical protein RL095_2386 [Verrucomicrobiota bacterium]|jgi:hypothetical protein